MMPLVESIKPLPKEEVSSLVKSQLTELLLSKWKHIYLSVNHSVSLQPLDKLPPEEPSHNASSPIGKRCLEVHLKRELNLKQFVPLSERERDLKKPSHLLRTSLINSE